MAQCWKRQISSGRLRLTRSEIPMVASTTAKNASAGERVSKLLAYGCRTHTHTHPPVSKVPPTFNKATQRYHKEELTMPIASPMT